MSAFIENAKDAYELIKKGMNIQAQEKLMQLREGALKLEEENLNLKKENLKLKEKVESKENFKFKRKVYFLDGDDIPFCPYCFEKSKLSIHLSGPETLADGSGQLYTCEECLRQYRTVGEEDFNIWD